MHIYAHLSVGNKVVQSNKFPKAKAVEMNTENWANSMLLGLY